MNVEYVRINSVTHANKAREILKRSKIKTRMRKSVIGGDGCTYFLEIDINDYDKVVKILTEYEIHFEECDGI